MSASRQNVGMTKTAALKFGLIPFHAYAHAGNHIDSVQESCQDPRLLQDRNPKEKMDTSRNPSPMQQGFDCGPTTTFSDACC